MFDKEQVVSALYHFFGKLGQCFVDLLIFILVAGSIAVSIGMVFKEPYITIPILVIFGLIWLFWHGLEYDPKKHKKKR